MLVCLCANLALLLELKDKILRAIRKTENSEMSVSVSCMNDEWQVAVGVSGRRCE